MKAIGILFSVLVSVWTRAAIGAEVVNAYTVGETQLICEYADGSTREQFDRSRRGSRQGSVYYRFGQQVGGGFAPHPKEQLLRICPKESGLELSAQRDARLAEEHARETQRQDAWHVLTNGPWKIATRGYGANLRTDLNCQTETGDWYITFKTSSYVTAVNGPVNVSIQFDGSERHAATWVAYSTDIVGPGHDRSPAFVEQMKHARRMQLGVANYRGQWQYSDYAVGATRPPDEVTTSCGIDW